jgi:hypothetical protein
MDDHSNEFLVRDCDQTEVVNVFDEPQHAPSPHSAGSNAFPSGEFADLVHVAKWDLIPDRLCGFDFDH